MEKVPARKLKGFRDHLPHEARCRKEIMDTVWQTALLAGFQPIYTPSVEFAETLLGSGGTETDKEVYRFVDHGEREVALRFDLTVPFARFVAENHAQLVMPFKKVQIGDVWRGEKPQKGRYREFCQADLDIVGADSLAADAEVVSCLMQALDQLVPSAFTMRLGNRVILSALIRRCLPQVAVAQEVAVLIALDKLEKIGQGGVTAILMEIPGAEAAGVAELLTTIGTRDAQGDTDMARVRALLADHGEAGAVVARFEETLAVLRGTAAARKGRYVADLSIARGLGYYTGIVFETTIDALPGFGSVSSGGRYNELVSRFTSLSLPGVGGSVGVDRLAAALQELGAVTPKPVAQAFIAVASDEATAYAFSLLQDLRAAGIPSDINVKPGKLGNQFKFADRMGYPLVLTIGGDELASGTVSLKVMASGEEQKGLPRAEGVAAVRAVLAKIPR